MDILVAQFKWVMLVGGLLTMSMLLMAVAPRVASRMMFGEEPQGPLAVMLARNWGALVFLSGGMLVWGAFHPEVRALVLIVSAAGKLAFIALVLGHPPFRAKAMGAVIIDGLLVALFAAYLAATL
jgi:hypothetical protein